MSTLLEIIAPDGQVRFVPLKAAQALNIGSDPSNDVVLDGTGIPEFLAVLTLDGVGAHIVALANSGTLRVDGQAQDAACTILPWQEVTAGGYTLLLMPEETAGEAERNAGSSLAHEESQSTGIALDTATGATASLATGALMANTVPGSILPREVSDEWIVTQIDNREWSVDVEQTATCELSLANGSDVVAAFEISVLGVDPEWVRINPPQINLNEAASTLVSINITPPRHPSSRAGVHDVAIVVKSATFPERMAVHRCALTIAPYYAFDVGELFPRQQTVGYRNSIAQSTVPITNLGNSPAGIRLDGQDDENGCLFEFEIPEQDIRLVKQAEMQLEPEQTFVAPIYVSPLKRSVIGLKRKEYAFNISAVLSSGTSTPRTVMGRMRVRPLIGPLLILLTLLLVGGGLAYYMRPTPSPVLRIAQASILPGDTVQLDYDANRFPGLDALNPINRLAGMLLNLSLEFKSGEGDWQLLLGPADVTKAFGKLEDVPTTNGRYRLHVESPISNLLPVLATYSTEAPVYITPVQPDVQTFEATPTNVTLGEPVTIRWAVQDADTLSLMVNGSEESLQGEELAHGTRELVLDRTTTLELVASNPSWAELVRKPLQVAVDIPAPVIVQFDVSPLEITQGETVNIAWEVEGADSVDILPLGQGLPLKGEIGAQPDALTTYRLSAVRTGPDGTQSKADSILREVVVNPAPTPTIPPLAPQIELFAATPNEIIKGDATEVMLTWSVKGDITDIQITSPTAALTGLAATDSITMTVSDVTLFVLTAVNGEMSSSMPLEVGGEDPTPTPEPTATPTPTPLPPLISFFKASGTAASDADKVSFTRTDTTSSGPVYVYQVEAGASVSVSWEASNADTVELEGYGPQPAESTFALPNTVVRPVTLILAATNGSGTTSKSYMRFEVEAPEPPIPPFSVLGHLEEDQVVLSWSYRTADREDITGFRIYRANLATDGIFVPVWTEYDPGATTWTDEGTTPCDKAYYVVAVYDDLVTETEMETGASTTSWYSPACP